MLIIVILIPKIVIKVIIVTLLCIFNPVTLTHLVCYPYTPSSWDHPENEDKNLISHVSALVPVELNNTESSGLEHHMSTLSNNIVNLSHNRLSSLSISYMGYLYHVFPLHVNTFHQLFTNWTRPQIDNLRTLLTNFYNLQGCILGELFSLCTVMAYLGGMVYLILVHILDSLSFIYGFNLLEISYIVSVKLNLESFTSKIKGIIDSTSKYIVALINTLISFFCNVINRIFIKIKAKLLYYLQLVKLQIYIDYIYLYADIESIIKLESELRSEVTKYIKSLEKVRELLTKLKTLISHIKILRTLMSIIDSFNKLIGNIACKLKEICSCSGDFAGFDCLLKQIPTGSADINKLNLILTTTYNLTHKILATIMRIEPSKINNFQEALNSIKNLLKPVDVFLSTKITSIIGQLTLLETINLGKLYKLIYRIDLLYQIILIREYWLIYTIKFYQEITPKISDLFNSLEFNCSNACQFFTSCSLLESKIGSVSSTINSNIIKLAQVCTSCNTTNVLLLKSILLYLIFIILWMKFYVDLMMREILIFKSIIDNLIVMSCSSVFIEFIECEITKLANVDNGIETLMVSHAWLRAFYLIQLENTMIIFGLSSKLLFSQSIHKQYHVLFSNLYWINKLIFVIECYIKHLIGFRHVTTSLTRIVEDIGSQLIIIDHILKVISSMAKITPKLRSIKTSMSNLNNINKSLQITTWKQDSQGIRQQIKLVRGYLNEIDSELSNIMLTLKSMSLSGNKLRWVYYYILILLAEVYGSILYTNYVSGVGIGITNKYFKGLLVSVIQPCNKILKFILVYLVMMWANICTLINIIRNSIRCIVLKVQCLHFLHNSIEEHINDIVKKVLEVECAIEAVVRNMIRCSLKSLSNNLKNHTGSNHTRMIQNDPLMINCSLLNVTNYKMVIDNLYELSVKVDQTLQLIRLTRDCRCIKLLEIENSDTIILKNIYFYNIMEDLSKSKEEFEKSLELDKIKKINEIDTSTNHFCLCVVNKYVLYPAIVKLFYIFSVDLEMLSTKSRKYEKYMNSTCFNSELSNFLTITIDLLYKVSKYALSQFQYSYKVDPYIVKNICFCVYSSNKYYNMFVSLTLLISKMIENIWSIDNYNIKLEIEKLSNLLSEYQTINYFTNYGSYPKDSSEESSKSNKLISKLISFTLNWLISLINILNINKDGLKKFCEIFSKLTFELSRKWENTEIKIIRPINICASNCYITKLNEICSNPCKANNSCKCEKEKIYLSIILVTNSYIKFALRIAIKEDLLYIMDLVKKNMFKEFLEIIKWVNYMNKETINGLELILRITKNNYSTHFNTYSSHKNIANSFPSLSVGYGYDSVYDHEQSSNSGYRGINGIREGYSNISSGRITKKNKMKEKERVNVYTLEYLHTRLKTGNNIKNYP